MLILLIALTSGLFTSHSTGASSQESETRINQHDISQLRTLAEAGDAAAQLQLSKAYRRGEAVTIDYQEAFKWASKSAQQNNSEAQDVLGQMYLVGQGVEQDKKTAVEWFHKSARQGNADAMYNLGTAYYNGDGVNVNDVLSCAWFTLSKENGNPMAGEAVQRAMSDLKPGIVTDGFVQIARMYEAGSDLPASQAEAAKWALKAAERGDSVAQRVIGMKLLSGTGVTQNFAAARDWCDKAAKQGDIAAEYCLGSVDQLGLGVNKNPKAARLHYEQAAQHRYPPAIKALAQMEASGEGGKADRPHACLLYFLLAAAGDNDALSKLTQLKRTMDAKEWKKVEELLSAKHIDPAKLNGALDKIKVQ